MSVDVLSIYKCQLSRVPSLETEEEFELARRYHSGDEEAGYVLISAHLRLVVKIANEFRRKWTENVLDLIQEGNVGLVKALNKFDPDRGIFFSYYASFWIRAYMMKFILDNWRIVKVGTTRAQRKLFYNLGREKQRLESMGITADPDSISESLDVSRTEVVEMIQRLGQNDLSLDMPQNDGSDAVLMDLIPDTGIGAEEIVLQTETARLLQENINELMPRLSDKERDIVRLRLLSENPLTLREIGEKYGLSRERIRQIEVKVLARIKSHVRNNISDFSSEWLECA